MTEYKVIPFEFEGENYAIKIFHKDRLINVVAFQRNYPANGFRHQIQVPKYVSVQDVLDHEVIGDLVKMCQDDIKEKRWERLVGGAKEKSD
jgi:hypothetical protein